MVPVRLDRDLLHKLLDWLCAGIVEQTLQFAAVSECLYHLDSGELRMDILMDRRGKSIRAMYIYNPAQAAMLFRKDFEQMELATVADYFVLELTRARPCFCPNIKGLGSC